MSNSGKNNEKIDDEMKECIKQKVSEEFQKKYESDIKPLKNQISKYGKAVVFIVMFLGFSGFLYVAVKIDKAIDYGVEFVQKRVMERLDTEFKSDRIQGLIEDTAKRYTEGEVQKYISTRVDEAIKPVQESLDEKLQETSRLVSDLKVAREFTMTVIAAQNDDRKAFDQLRAWADDKSYPFSSRAEQVWHTTLDDHATPWSEGGFTIPWSEGVDPSKLMLKDLRQTYGSAPSHLKPGLLEYIWNRQDVPKKDRMQFLIDVMQNDASLAAVEYAGRYFNSEAKLNFKPLYVAGFVNWWNENKSKY